MTEDRTKLLVKLEVRIKQVIVLCDKLKHENSLLKDEIAIKEDEMARLHDNINQLNKKYDNLKMARTITAASVDVDSAKVKLSQMVREVDKCIGLLKI